MSTIYDKTDNYGLNLYGDNDPADLRDGYNGSMRTIDTTLETHLNRIEGVESRETHDEEVVKALIGDNTVDSATTAKTKWDKAGADATTANTKADSNTNLINALEPRVQTLESRGRTQRNIVVLGDSWTVVHNNALYNRLKNVMPHAVWHNYGIGGAVVQELANEIENAKKDASLHPESVTDVIIVMGTNNVFWTNLHDYPDITKDAAYTAFRTVRDYFPNADIRFFPNNSKTLNGGRNYLYANIISGAKRAGVATHEESLNLLCGYIEWFNGDDQEGVQHLSDYGYAMFADRIANVLQGGILYSDGKLGYSVGYPGQYTNPTQSSEVDDNTLQIFVWDSATGGLRPIGWLGDPSTKFSYNSNQMMRVQIYGKIHITDPSDTPSSEGPFYIGCPNWYKRISKNTLPYIFLTGKLFSYYQPSTLSGFSKDYISGIESSSGEDKRKNVCYNSFYFRIPNPRSEDGKTIAIILNGVSTLITGTPEL